MTFRHAEIERKTIVILKILNEAQQPLGARMIARHMQDYGVSLSERAVRYHLQFMDERELTELVGRRDGRIITGRGIEELRNARVQDKVGLAITRIEALSYRTTFDPERLTGLLPVNVTFFARSDWPRALKAMRPVIEAGIGVSDRVAVRGEGGCLGDVTVPEGQVGLATVCSIVINGVLLKRGIPLDSKFGGILELKGGRPLRFVELIHYSGSSLDPSEAFIRAKMTSVRAVVSGGEGKILANFREVAGICRHEVAQVLPLLTRSGIHGVLTMGLASESICEVPVELNRVGIIMTGGLNPVAAALEAGIPAETKAMSAMMDYGELQDFAEVYREDAG